jgi:hypothetical protein
MCNKFCSVLFYEAGCSTEAQLFMCDVPFRISVGLPDIQIEICCGFCLCPKGDNKDISLMTSSFQSLPTLCPCYSPFVRRYITSKTALLT